MDDIFVVIYRYDCIHVCSWQLYESSIDRDPMARKSSVFCFLYGCNFMFGIFMVIPHGLQSFTED